MKTKLLVFFLFVYHLSTAQFSQQKIITGCEACEATDAYSTDLDGDGDMDILSSSYDDDKIAWYENDGNGNFSKQKIISVEADGAKSVYSSDIDGDGDMDVLSASENDDKIAWYENNRNGIFSEPKIISNQVYIANNVYG